MSLIINISRTSYAMLIINLINKFIIKRIKISFILTRINDINKIISDFTYSIRRYKNILRVYIYIESVDANVLINLIIYLIKREYIN